MSSTDVLNINGKPASRYNALVVHETKYSILLDLDGDEAWFPKTTVRENHDGTFDIQDWIFNQKFPNG